MSEFSLRKERERLKKIMIMSLTTSEILDFGSAEVISEKYFGVIEKQDKEFIKKLKDNLNINAEEFEDTGRFYLEVDDCIALINKLAGEIE